MPKTNKEDLIVINLSGRGDKDLNTIREKLNNKLSSETH